MNDMPSSGPSDAPALHVDLTLLYNRPWVLYKCPGTLPTIQRNDLVNAVESFDEEEPTVPVFGEVLECTVDPISTSTLDGAAVHCVFRSGTVFRLIHISNPTKEVSLLLLSTSGPRRSVLELFDKVLGIPLSEELKPPGSILSSQLELYLEELFPLVPMRDTQSFIHDVVGKVDITVTSDAPIAPNLRSLDIGFPATEVWNWLSSSPRQGTFLARLTEHLQSNTGLRLDLDSPRGTKARDTPISISKVSCSAFTLTTEGRLTMRKEPRTVVDLALRSMIRTFNERLLEELLNAANDRC